MLYSGHISYSLSNTVSCDRFYKDYSKDFTDEDPDRDFSYSKVVIAVSDPDEIEHSRYYRFVHRASHMLADARVCVLQRCDMLSLFNRGPYAYAATDYKGYDCGLMGCPRGDNPVTPSGM